MSKINKAIELAVKYHKGQYRKGGLHGIALPYVFHPLEVAKLVWSWRASEDMVMAAICHDILEDVGHSESERNYIADNLREVIGDKATNIVKELTWDQSIPKEEYIKTFHHASVEALVVKIADRITNSRDFSLTNPDYAYQYFEKAKELFIAYQNRQEEIKAKLGTDVITQINIILVEWLPAVGWQ